MQKVHVSNARVNTDTTYKNMSKISKKGTVRQTNRTDLWKLYTDIDVAVETRNFYRVSNVFHLF